MAPLHRWVAVAALALLASATAGPAEAQVAPIPGVLAEPTPSDPRATFVPGNATTCADAGFPDSTKVGAGDNSSAADAYVSGTVATNGGTVHPGEGEELNVELLDEGAVVDAVVVKGGPAHNIYDDPAVLPPTAGAPQHYISPFNGGGNVPDISHWFVCYHPTEPEPMGSLTVVKDVIAPDGRPAEPLPTTFSAVVDCDDGVNEDIEVNFARGGGRASVGPTVTDIPVGTTCTVTELGRDTFPAGTTVTFDPPGADVTGVTIAGTDGVVVTVTNDFTGVALATADVTVTKEVVPVAGVDVPPTFGATVRCDDGTETTVELPGGGGAGTPVVTVPVLAVCLVEEVAVPAGWTVTYSVDGTAPTPVPPVFVVDDTASITVAITNDPSAVAGTDATTTSDPTPPPGGAVGGATAGGALPDTGGVDPALVGLGLTSVVAGSAALRHATRLRARASRGQVPTSRPG